MYTYKFLNTIVFSIVLGVFLLLTVNNTAFAQSRSIRNRGFSKYTINIHPGYNFINIPVKLRNKSIHTVFGNQLTSGFDIDSGDTITKWNIKTQDYGESAVLVNGVWYNKDKYPRLSRMKFKINEGFVVYHNGNDTLEVKIYGKEVKETLPRIKVENGDRQLVGTTYLSNLPLQETSFDLIGSDNPLTAERILYWDVSSQEYVSSWYCGGLVCESWGDEWANKWLKNDYSLSDLVLEPWHAFFFVSASN